MRRLLYSAIAVVGSVTACASGSSGRRTEGAYCAEIGRHADELGSPTITTAADVARTLRMYRSVAASAPLQVEREWATIVATVETASTVDPGDQASLQRAADTARLAQPAYATVSDYTQELCGTTIGQPATAATTTTTTTAPGTEATPPGTAPAAAVGG